MMNIYICINFFLSYKKKQMDTNVVQLAFADVTKAYDNVDLIILNAIIL